MSGLTRVLWAASCAVGTLGAVAGSAWAGNWSAADLIKASSAESPWVNIGIGGGGAFFYPSGSPHDVNLVFVSSDMGQLLRSTDAGKNWRMIDWRSSPAVRWPVFHPTDPNVVYAYSGGDRLRVSKDKGMLWEVVHGDNPPWKGHNLLMITISRANPKLMLLSSDKGLFLSTDGGEKWQEIKGAPAGMLNLFIASASPAGKPVCFGASKDGVFRSDDGGKSWYQAFSRRAEGQGAPGKGQRWGSCGAEDTTCWRYVFDPYDTNRTYICYTDIGFARSEDRGKTWFYDSKNRPCRNTTYDLAPDPDVPGVFWGAFSDMHDIPSWRYCLGPGKARGGIAKSTDHCKSWENPPIDYDKKICSYIEGMTVTIHPQKRNVLYFCTCTHGMFLSKDSGKTWTELGPLKSPPFANCTRVFWDPNDAKTIYVVTFGGGVWNGPDPAAE